MTRPTALACLTSTLLLGGCVSVSNQLADARTYEQEGMLREAHARYSEVYERRHRNVEAHIGMQRTAQAWLDRLESEASGHYLSGTLDRADKAYADVDQYAARMQREGLSLVRDPLLPVRRREARQQSADALYEQAETAFRTDRFVVAEQLAAQVLRLQPDRREAEHLRKLAQLEPRYREGLRAEELGLWRDAYHRYKQVTDRDPAYREAWTRMEHARLQASYSLAYVPVFDTTPYSDLWGTRLQPGAAEMALAGAVRQAIVDLDDPLIMLIDRENTEQLLAEQQRTMNGTFDDAHVAEAGKLMGARYVLACRMTRYDEVLTRQAEVQLQVIDAETGRIQLAETIRVTRHELDKGNTRAQLVDLAAKRIAARIAGFDPYAK